MRGFVIGSALAVLAAAGVVELRAQRHVDATSAQEAQAKLDAIPLTVGDWVGERHPFDLKQLERANAVAHAHVQFVNAKTRDAVTVLIIAGPPGEIGAHDPTRCYAGAGYQLIGTPQRKTLTELTGGSPNGCWLARFDTDTFPAASLQVGWAWTTNGSWQAADDARYEFAGHGLLYKLYVSRSLTGSDAGSPVDDPLERFLAAFLPAAQTFLAPR